MATFPFELVSPERLVYSGAVTEVIVPGAEGEFGILAGHAPFVSTLKPGVLTIKGDGAARKLFVRGGFAEANPQGLTVLAETAIPLAELPAEKLAQMIRNAQEDVEDAGDEATRASRQQFLEQLKSAAAAIEADSRSPH
ncbi:F0F1 ATP synthase subunit epsilon [Ancylobacter dichloromethanicus]|uniref:ATP synthase epsilon chain n=1 Tax=Ancylobacter dichloromethanicus TaxID=518825 RepID=A0A9W6N0B0_9HYPH|nr:F0F1 ATP synthase subunit epsilon [Ancylobacter dichloromethanicus]MBS7553223.1 F0F1 ATP synthase subunit epsilon [Ancylobacter dichloromethanicus]GLK73003.1 ATP synthase epsilon chain [Ancylobacter dichloromethanicus]